MSSLPLDIRPNWLKVVRSMQAQSCRQRGTAVLSIRVVVDKEGNPLYWTEPSLTKIEPAASGALSEMVVALGG